LALSLIFPQPPPRLQRILSFITHECLVHSPHTKSF